MARKRARTATGHYQADDPSTPDVNEAFEQEEAPKEPSPSKTARQKKAPKNDNKPQFVYYVSSEPENGAFDLRITDNVRVSGRWDAERSYVHWRVPREVSDLAKLHHHIWSGRVICCEDE